MTILSIIILGLVILAFAGLIYVSYENRRLQLTNSELERKLQRAHALLAANIQDEDIPDSELQ